MLVIAVILFILGLALGSFVNALVWRLHEQTKPRAKKTDLSILKGRSICPHCRRRLSWYDLIPIISWLWLRGQCRYCRNPISVQYPVVELLMGLIFALSYLFWPEPLHLSGQWILLATWLGCSVGLIALAVYDLRWMLLPNKLIYPTLLLAVIGRLAFITAFEKHLLHALLLWLFSVVIASGVFLALFIVSDGKWIGYGDVRLGLITGTLLADPQKSLAMLFLASLIGTLIILPGLARGNKSLASKLPYGPFLISATAILVVFGDSLLNWYKNLIL
jgi:prepilin signal peptidase PulO-like enzyme (type II secretory pathway)